MTWVRVDDEFTDHAKVAPLSDAALRLWLEASCWSRKPHNLKHEGKIPEALLVSIGKNRWPKSKALKLAAELVAATGGGLYEQGLWIKVDGGWQIHDWQVYGTAEQDPESLSAKRSLAGSKGAFARWQKDGKTNSKPEVANSKLMPPDPDPDPREKDPPTPEQQLQARRAQDALTGDAPGRRPDVLRVHDAWRRAFGRQNSKFRNDLDEDAYRIADAIKVHGEENCILVARYAPNDDMVSGRSDEKGAKHESIRYIFGNEDAFSRILAAAERERSSQTRLTPSQVVARSKAGVA